MSLKVNEISFKEKENGSAADVNTETKENKEIKDTKNIHETKEEIKKNLPKKPIDKFHLVYFIFLLQGTGMLFPYNAFISAPDYFSRLYGKDILFYLTIADSIPNLLGLLLSLYLVPKISIKWRIYPAYILTFFILIAVPILGFLEVRGLTGLIITVILVILQALCTSALQGMFAVASALPSSYMQAVMSGNGISSVICSVLRIVTKLGIEQNRKHIPMSLLNISTAIYFFICAFVILLCIFSFWIVMRSEFLQFYLQKAEGQEEEKRIQELKETKIETTIKLEENNNQTEIKLEENNDHKEIHHPPEQPLLRNKPNIFNTFQKIWSYCVLVCTVFFISYSIFPGIAVTVPTWYINTEMVNWLPVLITASFNFFDFAGRSFAGIIILIKGKWIIVTIILHSLFLPLFIFYYKPEIFNLDAFNDAFPLITIALLALSNGYNSSLCMMFAPEVVEDHAKEYAGSIMAFFLLLGVTLGSNTCLGIGKLLDSIFKGKETVYLE
ncbi:hypothetical protein ABK040_015224 [Willaertia magna]